MGKADKSKGQDNVVATNRKAFRDYFVLEKIEAGIELVGTEVKSIRAGHISLNEAFGKVENGQVFLHDVQIQPYEFGNRFNHDAKRVKRLLLHKREILKLNGNLITKGLTLVPLRMYLKNRRFKVELGLCKGKHTFDKRETIKRRTADREAQRVIASANKRSS